MNTDSHTTESLGKSMKLLSDYEEKIPQHLVYPVWTGNKLTFEEA